MTTEGEGSAVSQADGYASSPTKDVSAGEGELPPFFYASSGNTVRNHIVGDGPAREPQSENYSRYSAANEAAYRDVLSLAGRFMEAPGPTSVFAAVEVNDDIAGEMRALSDLFAGIYEVIEFVVPNCGERDIALCKLKEAAMWAKDGISRG
jgi:hypothetical protein